MRRISKINRQFQINLDRGGNDDNDGDDEGGVNDDGSTVDWQFGIIKFFQYPPAIPLGVRRSIIKL